MGYFSFLSGIDTVSLDNHHVFSFDIPNHRVKIRHIDSGEDGSWYEYAAGLVPTSIWHNHRDKGTIHYNDGSFQRILMDFETMTITYLKRERGSDESDN